MPNHPGFTVRSYPTFRAARMYRVLVGPDALYFIRMKGLISPSDAGSAIHVDPGNYAASAIIRWLGRKTVESGLAEVDGCDPEEMVRSSKKHFKLDVADFVRSSLEPPSMLSGHGHYYAFWKVVTRDFRDRLQIEDAQSLASALEFLPGLLGAKLTVSVDPPHGGERARSRIMG